MPKHTPVFEKDGNKFVVPVEGWWSEDPFEVAYIAIGSLVESVLFDMKWTGESVDMEGELEHIPAKLGHLPIALLSGPAFDAHLEPEGENEDAGRLPEGRSSDESVERSELVDGGVQPE